MIKNVMFDMGQVLLRFDRRAFLDRLDVTEEEKQLLMREVFLSTEWVRMDRGALDEPQAEPLMCARLPQHLHGAVHALASEWDEPILPVEGMEELVRELKDAGYGVYLLSNASRRQHDYWHKVPGNALFDDTLISADIGVMKPHPDIYRKAMEKFGLIPEETFFVDDVPANIEGANFCGIAGAVFHGDTALLRKAMREAGIRVAEEIAHPAMSSFPTLSS